MPVQGRKATRCVSSMDSEQQPMLPDEMKPNYGDWARQHASGPMVALALGW